MNRLDAVRTLSLLNLDLKDGHGIDRFSEDKLIEALDVILTPSQGTWIDESPRPTPAEIYAQLGEN